MSSDGHIMIEPARRGDAGDIAVLTDMAGHGLPAHFWATAGERASGTSLLEIGRGRALRESGNFSWRNAWMARSDGTAAGMILGYRLPDQMQPDDLSDVPELVRPLVQLEARAPSSWYLNVLAVYPEHRRRGLGGVLLNHAVAVASADGASEVSLIVEDVNDDARRLYLRMGFGDRAKMAYVPFPHGPAAREWILMVRDLH